METNKLVSAQRDDLPDYTWLEAYNEDVLRDYNIRQRRDSSQTRARKYRRREEPHGRKQERV